MKTTRNVLLALAAFFALGPLVSLSQVVTQTIPGIYQFGAGGILGIASNNARLDFATTQTVNSAYILYNNSNNSLETVIGRNGPASDWVVRNSVNEWLRLKNNTGGFAQSLLNSARTIQAGGEANGYCQTTSVICVLVGSGAPTVSAAKGSLYLRSDGTTTNDRLYVNTNGTTGWAAITTAS